VYSLGDRIYIEPVCLDDAEFLIELRNDPYVWSNMTNPHMLVLSQQKKWIDSIDHISKKYFIVYAQKTKERIGLIRCDEIDYLNQSMRVGADITKKFRGKGFAHEIYALIKKYCFDYLNMHRLWLSVLATNDKAINLYQQQNFIQEGRYREAIFRDGKYHDYVIMSILKSEWRNDG
jgi:RimJ/RimL family protein N-acetyltransferase